MTEETAGAPVRVKGRADSTEGFIRRKALTAHNDASMRTVVDAGEYGTFAMDEPTAHGGTGAGPSPLQTVLGALCGCEAVTFHRTAAEYGFDYSSLDFEGSYTIDIRGRQGDRAVRPHFRTVRLRVIVATEEPVERLTEVAAETEARCPVFNLVRDADVDVEVEWLHEPVT